MSRRKVEIHSTFRCSGIFRFSISIVPIVEMSPTATFSAKWRLAFNLFDEDSEDDDFVDVFVILSYVCGNIGNEFFELTLLLISALSNRRPY